MVRLLRESVGMVAVHHTTCSSPIGAKFPDTFETWFQAAALAVMVVVTLGTGV